MNIVDLCSDGTTLITGNDGYALFKGDTRFHVYEIHHIRSNCLFSRIYRYLWVLIRISQQIRKRRSSVDKWIFIFFFGSGAFLPLLTAKFSKKPTALLLTGADTQFVNTAKDPLSCAYKALTYASYVLIDKFIIYSPSLITKWNLKKYRHKILIAHRHFLDFDMFAVTTPLSDRPLLIGYIGRLSEEKGVQHFIQTLPAIFYDQPDLRVLIGGDGQLKESVEKFLQEERLTARVDFPGWISHENLSKYLNQLRLLVIPSYTEGLPNIMLEAMACGTPVLATPVGAIPDVIKDCKTGFIMENNSPECIAENVIRVLTSPDMEQVAEKGRRFVEENFTFERVIARWKEVLEKV
jgi:glycosyltransferase involved in cell wall biosynthesis